MSERPTEVVVEPGRLPLARIVSIEFAALAALSLVSVPFDASSALAICLGGATIVLPNAFMAARFSRALDKGAGFGALVVAELGKLALTASLFVLVFVSVESLNHPLYFVSVALFQFVHWLTLYLCRTD